MKCKLFGHKWKENHRHPMFHATRVCKRCGKIEIKAAKVVWCNNYANINKSEAMKERLDKKK